MHFILRWHYVIILGILLHSHSSIGLPQLTISNHSNFILDDLASDIFFINTLDQNNITKLITRLGNWGVGRLLWHVKEMNHLGDRIRHVHPLCFLSYIYSQPELTKCMKLINHSYFKRKEFIAGLSEKMEMEAERNNLLPYVKHFSEKIGCTRSEDIFIFLDRHDWIGLLAYLDELQIEKGQ